MKNLEKNVPRGTANCEVLGDGTGGERDFAHVATATPLDTKRKEIQGDPQYQADAINPAREQRTSAKRRNKDVRPL